ncbi:flagellar hook assembly protein FlgD [Maricurvus nonylphenolicus]|uniref:flagellar hook assembly protein FlgD n=1 Tax=Maricurvus nonylphenolicus TaxID=1008307 RepID=UPI0036F26C86
MSDVSAASATSGLSDLQIATKTEDEKKDNELGQSAFLELMIAQLNNQDPLNPEENGDFIAQLAQFSSVEGIDRLNNNFEGFTNSFMSNQALQASSLVGRSVTVSASSTQLYAGSFVSGSIDLPASTSDVQVNIYDDAGALVDQVSMGYQSQGEVLFRWDGYNFEANGELLDWQSSHEEGLPPGEYRFDVTASIDGETTQLDTALSANVNSVTVGQDGKLILNLAGHGSVNMSDVKQFN